MWKLAGFGLCCAISTGVVAATSGTFETIADPVCTSTSDPNIWSTGEQYVDSNNGVIQDKWAMLVRWQGPNFVNNAVGYDMGAYTGLYGATQQRGVQPEQSGGSAGVQAKCMDIGMWINTWTNAHRPIVGGGYNDMWGRSFTGVHPFSNNGQNTDLVLQSNIKVSWWGAYDPHPVAGGDTAQVSLFAYLRDTSPLHANLHPIVVAGFSHMTNLIVGGDTTWEQQGGVGYDYSGTDTNNAKANWPNWFPNTPTSGSGIWFAAAPIRWGANNPNNPNKQNYPLPYNQHYITIVYTGATIEGNLAPVQDGSPTSGPTMPFYRMHVTRQNLINIVTDINNATCGSDCPAKGYSLNPDDYVLEYAGVIAEATIRSETLPSPSTPFDTSPTNWVGLFTNPIYDDNQKNQIALGVHLYAPGIYRYYD